MDLHKERTGTPIHTLQLPGVSKFRPYNGSTLRRELLLYFKSVVGGQQLNRNGVTWCRTRGETAQRGLKWNGMQGPEVYTYWLVSTNYQQKETSAWTWQCNKANYTNTHMGHAHNGDHMANSYSMYQPTFECTRPDYSKYVVGSCCHLVGHDIFIEVSDHTCGHKA